MIMSPFILTVAPSVSGWVTSRRLIKRLGRIRKAAEAEGYPRKRKDHVIIIGFGLNGKNLARVLKESDIPYVVLEMNSDTVREMKKKSEPIYYGDGTSTDILRRMGVETARLLVVAISDPSSTRRITATARHENPALYIIVRTKYLSEVDDLEALGANEVIPEEFETSVEIFSRVLHQYRFPRNIIMDMAERVRSNSYKALRSIDLPKRHLFDKDATLPGMEVDGFSIQERSALVGRSIAELQVRKKTGVTVIAVRRGVHVFTNPEPDFRFKAGDILLFTGSREAMNAATEYFRSISQVP
jgi:CPA2 family monovalent cation:H+ antiporter-2